MASKLVWIQIGNGDSRMTLARRTENDQTAVMMALDKLTVVEARMITDCYVIDVEEMRDAMKHVKL